METKKQATGAARSAAALSQRQRRWQRMPLRLCARREPARTAGGHKGRPYGGAPDPQRDNEARSAREQGTAKPADEKAVAPQAQGVFPGGVSSCPSRRGAGVRRKYDGFVGASASAGLPNVQKELPTAEYRVKRLSEALGTDVVFKLRALPYGR